MIKFVPSYLEEVFHDQILLCRALLSAYHFCRFSQLLNETRGISEPKSWVYAVHVMYFFYPLSKFSLYKQQHKAL